jgi:hypothetical protein
MLCFNKVRENVVLAGLRQENKFQDNFSSIMAGKALSAQIKAQQDLVEQADRNKKVRQFEEWNTEVYGKISGRVAEKNDLVPAKEITRRRNKYFQEFLDMTNSKGAIFRDIIIESEYDPLEPNRRSIKVSLNFPSSSIVQKRIHTYIHTYIHNYIHTHTHTQQS